MSETKSEGVETKVENEADVLASAARLGRNGSFSLYDNHSKRDLAMACWVRSHPAMRKANDAVVHAEHESNLITGMLVELFDAESTLPFEPGPHEGMTQDEVEMAEEEAKKISAESLAELRKAIKAYGVPVPQRAEKK